MEKYIGTKEVQAEPCSMDQFAGAKNFNDLSKLSGGVDQHGYKVVYEDGYTSWSPKDVFEKAYKVANNFKDRLVIERDELSYRCNELSRIVNDNSLPNNQIILLKEQLGVMYKYLGLLVVRLNKL